jgi:hypothetical protein
MHEKRFPPRPPLKSHVLTRARTHTHTSLRRPSFHNVLCYRSTRIVPDRWRSGVVTCTVFIVDILVFYKISERGHLLLSM